jgi:hypothetical protein
MPVVCTENLNPDVVVMEGTVTLIGNLQAK